MTEIHGTKYIEDGLIPFEFVNSQELTEIE